MADRERFRAFTEFPHQQVNIDGDSAFSNHHSKRRKLTSLELPPKLDHEDETCRQLREEVHSMCLSMLQKAYQRARISFSYSLRTKFEHFVRKECLDLGCPGDIELLPVFMIESGLHVNDRTMLINILEGWAKKRCDCTVVKLEAIDCPSLNDIFSSMLKQLNKQQRNVQFETSATFLDDLPKILANIQNQGHRPPDKEVPSDSLKPLIILLMDPESFDFGLLNRFIEIIADKKERGWGGGGGGAGVGRRRRRGGPGEGAGVPAVALALATHPAAGPPPLGRRVADRCRVDRARAGSAIDLLEMLIDELFFKEERLPIMIGPQMYGWMKQSFLESHLCVKTFLRQAERALLAHLRRPSPAAAAHLAALGAPRAYMARHGYDNHGKFESMLLECAKPSLLDNAKTTDLSKSTANDNELFQTIVNHIENQRAKLLQFHIASAWIREMVHKRCYPNTVDTNKFTWLNILHSFLSLSQEFVSVVDKLFEGLKNMKIQQLGELVEKWKAIFETYTTSSFYKTGSNMVLDKTFEDLESVHILLKYSQTDDVQESSLRAGLCGEVQMLLLNITACPHSSWISGKFHEVWWHDDRRAAAAAWEAAPRAAAAAALARPAAPARLGCRCCGGAAAAGPGALDLCLAYQLYEDRGRRIDKDEWFDAFARAATGLTKSNGRDEAARANTQEIMIDPKQGRLLWARFLQATTELSILGFVKQDRRKNTMSRLVYAYTMSSLPDG